MFITELTPLKSEDIFQKYMGATRRQGAKELRPIIMDFELTNRCTGSCSYCYTNSTSISDIHIPTEKVLSLIDEMADMGIRQIQWAGGEPKLHPDFFKSVDYTAEKGIRNFLATGGLVSQREAKRISKIPNLHIVNFHIDCINKEAYNQVHTNPKTLEKRLQGYRNLLEEGIHPSRIFGCICLTSPVIEAIEETLDWYVDEMKAEYVGFEPFRPQGFGDRLRYLEPDLSAMKRAMDYRAKKLGDFWLGIGTMECGRYYCQDKFCISYGGFVYPCTEVRVPVGNIYGESLREIFDRNKEDLLYQFEVKGACGICQYKETCFGCRANAHIYLGDREESDPKCPLNLAAKERYFN